MFNKNYSKFMASAATAALVATAVVPAVGAQENIEAQQTFAFTDVSPANSHADNIYRAYDLGIMTGYANGKFGTKDDLPRKHVVKALGKYVLAQQGLTISDISLEDLSDITPFNDVPNDYRDSELALYSLIVKEAGIFEGVNNTLMPDTLITRQQMAQVLVNAFGLEDLAGVESKVTDNNLAFSYYRDDIDILSENGITTEERFRPRENVKRDQFASFLVRTYDATHPEEGTPEDAVAEFEKEMRGFSSLADDYGFDISLNLGQENTFNVVLPEQLPEVKGTGFFTTLAEQGIETISIGNTEFTISDGEGNVIGDAAAVRDAILRSLANSTSFELTVDIPYSDGVVSETYIFNIVL